MEGNTANIIFLKAILEVNQKVWHHFHTSKIKVSRELLGVILKSKQFRFWKNKRIKLISQLYPQGQWHTAGFSNFQVKLVSGKQRETFPNSFRDSINLFKCSATTTTTKKINTLGKYQNLKGTRLVLQLHFI